MKVSLLVLMAVQASLHGAQQYPATISSRADIIATPADHYAIDLAGLPLADYPLLGKFVKLRQLSFHLQSGGTTDENLAALVKIENFRVHHVHLHAASQVTDAGVASLLSIPTVATVNLDGTALTDESCRKLGQRSGLTGVSILECKGVSFAGLKQVLGNRSLRLVAFSLGALDPRAVAGLPGRHPWIAHWTIVDPDAKLAALLANGPQPSGVVIDLRKRREIPDYP